MFGPKWSQHIDKTRMLHDSIFISWISSSVAPTRTAPPEHSLFQGSFYFLHVETDVSLGCCSLLVFVRTTFGEVGHGSSGLKRQSNLALRPIGAGPSNQITAFDPDETMRLIEQRKVEMRKALEARLSTAAEREQLARQLIRFAQQTTTKNLISQLNSSYSSHECSPFTLFLKI